MNMKTYALLEIKYTEHSNWQNIKYFILPLHNKTQKLILALIFYFKYASFIAIDSINVK